MGHTERAPGEIVVRSGILIGIFYCNYFTVYSASRQIPPPLCTRMLLAGLSGRLVGAARVPRPTGYPADATPEFMVALRALALGQAQELVCGEGGRTVWGGGRG